MTDEKLKKIYRQACDTRGFEPSDGQFKTWKQILGWVEAEDMERALQVWWSSNTSFPMPAELRPICASCRREREARSSEKTYLVRWLCSACGGFSCAWIAIADSGKRICRGIPRDGRRGFCGTALTIVHDERPTAITQYFQQQVCPQCNGVVEMMRPIGEQFRTWCIPCQAYRKIVPEDLKLNKGEWKSLCAELEAIYRTWKEGGSKLQECIDPQFDRELVRGRA